MNTLNLKYCKVATYLRVSGWIWNCKCGGSAGITHQTRRLLATAFPSRPLTVLGLTHFLRNPCSDLLVKTDVCPWSVWGVLLLCVFETQRLRNTRGDALGELSEHVLLKQIVKHRTSIRSAHSKWERLLKRTERWKSSASMQSLIGCTTGRRSDSLKCPHGIGRTAIQRAFLL